MASKQNAFEKLSDGIAVAAPISVIFQVTDRCNYECVHCYQEHTKKPELSTEEAKSVMKQLADAGVLFLALMGGEYFMRPDADELLQAARDLGFAIRLKSTGHHITEKRADFIATLKPIQVDLSVYGADGRIHDAVTRQEGSWKRTFAAARRLIARGIGVQLNTPVMEENAGELDALRTLASELGAACSFDPKITGMENSDQSPTGLRMSAATLQAFYDKRWAAAAVEKQMQVAGGEGPLGGRPCGAGQRTLGISPQGDVWPCNSLPLACGNLREESFEQIWNHSPELKNLRSVTWGDIEECNVCELRKYCSRCHAMAKLEQGKMIGPSLEACRHAVATREALRRQGSVPDSEQAMPPTWDRIDPDGQHQHKTVEGTRRPKALRVLSH